jgi:glycosyltransferase involved in cell wall biosynthesis
MRVALIGRYRVPYPFSEHRLDYVMLKAWAKQMERLDVVVQGSQKRYHIWQDGNLVVHYAPSVAFVRYVPGFVLWAAYKLIALDRKAPIDIVNGSDLWGGLVGIMLRPVIRAKVLAQLQGEFLPPSRFSYPAIYRGLLYLVALLVSRNADIVRCLYQAAAERVAALGVPRSKIAVVPSRCDTALFDIRRFPPKDATRHRLLYVGNLISGKGVSFLLHALSHVVHEYPDATLSIVGKGPQELELKKLTVKLGLSQYVRFLGHRQHDELPAIMHEANLFAFPSLSEATPRAVLEAMAMELPVVATRVGGIPEMIEDGITGVLVQPASIPELANAIIWVLSHPEWAQKAGRLARQHVLEHYTLEQHTERMLALHHKVLAS